MVVLTSKYIEENNPHLTTYKCTNKKPTTNVKPSNKKNKNKAHFFSINLNVVKKVQKVYREKKKTIKFITIFSNTIHRTKEENYKQDFFFQVYFCRYSFFYRLLATFQFVQLFTQNEVYEELEIYFQHLQQQLIYLLHHQL